MTNSTIQHPRLLAFHPGAACLEMSLCGCAPRRAAARLAVTALRLDQISAGLATTAGVAALAGVSLVMGTRKLEPCEMCGGAGHWGCVICDGEGVLKVSGGRATKECVACVGRGKRICRKCEGSGWKRGSNYIVSWLTDGRARWEVLAVVGHDVWLFWSRAVSMFCMFAGLELTSLLWCIFFHRHV